MKKTHWLAEEVKAIRLQKGLSMMHGAAGALVHPNTIQRYEAGDSSMSIESVERVLKVLGYELEAISIEK